MKMEELLPLIVCLFTLNYCHSQLRSVNSLKWFEGQISCQVCSTMDTLKEITSQSD